MLSAIGLPTFGGAAVARLTSRKTDIETALNAAYEKYRTVQEGKNADYIPALAKVDPKIYGIALVTNDGRIYTAGDVTSEVSIQSLSKGVHHGKGHRGIRSANRSQITLGSTRPARCSTRL